MLFNPSSAVNGGVIKFTPMCFSKENHRMKVNSWGLTLAALFAVFVAQIGGVTCFVMRFPPIVS